MKSIIVLLSILLPQSLFGQSDTIWLKGQDVSDTATYCCLDFGHEQDSTVEIVVIVPCNVETVDICFYSNTDSALDSVELKAGSRLVMPILGDSYSKVSNQHFLSGAHVDLRRYLGSLWSMRPEFPFGGHMRSVLLFIKYFDPVAQIPRKYYITLHFRAA